MRFLLLILLCLVPLSHADSFLDRLPLLGGAKKAVILHPDKAFGLEVSVRDESTLLANFRITPDYYLYRDKIKFTISGDSAKAADVKITNVSMPKGEMKSDPNFGDMAVFHQSFQAVITLKRNNNTTQDITLAASYQGCKENDLCYAPIDKQFNIVLPKASLASTISPLMQAAPQTAQGVAMPADSESTQLAKLFKQGGFWLIVTFFFGAGLLLAFTPCVLPMIPILSGIIVGHSSHPTKMHSFLLSLAYVLGMALTYAAIGVAAGLSGTLLSSALQTPWVLGSFAALFVLLSLSMFGFYELQLPAVLQSKLTNTSNRLHGGHLSGVFMMGALSAVIVSPCVAAPMAAALLYIGQTHDALLGGTALFALAMGMGLPLILIGASAGALLPKAGAWMEVVKHFFGVLMLALAIWLISPLIPLSIQMLLWGTLLVLSAIYMHALDALPNHASGWQKLWKGIGILALLLGSAYLVGALSGARDILQPLAAIGNGKTEAISTLKFERIKNVAELDTRIAQANGKTVMLDFYADWCISCKEMERFTFSDAKVQAKLRNAVLLQIDVTANNDEDKALLKRFELFGPPAILFFDAQGREQDGRRVIGYQGAAQFLQSLTYVGL
ncbi:Thiol:disulfide interchange protein DsbD [Candidatus Nitrotoga sp. BS]|uniref:protein-disulfide reductase DsbD n=1 Tax=Candidatus Nitrotoga sp. BS TaxID=2890408 RepID=UPI001EF21F9E|nr:protein-disulfide reductase DsbD [Candidatus Nitrotoga sp. BS]CAH1201201.1 Thiol:disulfide interchange protein DsbD [Candidatus Nitrotoga sp. BS]